MLLILSNVRKESVSINVDMTDTIKSVKDTLLRNNSFIRINHESINNDLKKLELVYAGKVLENNQTVYSAGLRDNLIVIYFFKTVDDGKREIVFPEPEEYVYVKETKIESSVKVEKKECGEIIDVNNDDIIQCFINDDDSLLAFLVESSLIDDDIRNDMKEYPPFGSDCLAKKMINNPEFKLSIDVSKYKTDGQYDFDRAYQDNPELFIEAFEFTNYDEQLIESIGKLGFDKKIAKRIYTRCIDDDEINSDFLID